MTRDEILTTGAVSKIIGMSQRTVCRLIDDGWLSGWKVPGSSHRRVARRDLEAFMSEHGIPMPTSEATS